MSRESRTGAVLTVVSALLAIVVGLFVVMAAVASYKTASVERRWTRTLGTKDEILRRYPAVEANVAAFELERLSAALGIDTAPRQAEGRARPEKGNVIRPKDLHGIMGTWRGEQLARNHRAVVGPPPEVLAFVDAHERELEAVRLHLTRGVVPRWEMHLERMYEAPLPNLLGHIQLQKLLATDALIRIRRDDHETARRDLEAAWTLMQALWDDPFLITQLIAMADARLILGVLRQLDEAPPVWRARLAEHDFRGSFTTALKFEGWIWTQVEEASAHAGFSGLASRLMRSVAKPYYRYCMADASDAWRRRLENLDGVDGICDHDLAEHEANLDIPVPRWNVVAEIVTPNLSGTIYRLARLELDLELTSRLLELERLRRAGGEWPASLPGGDVSSACPEDRWRYEVGPDGSMMLAFGREIEWPAVFKGQRLATEFRVAAPPG